jgi:hypothetical protein
VREPALSLSLGELNRQVEGCWESDQFSGLVCLQRSTVEDARCARKPNPGCNGIDSGRTDSLLLVWRCRHVSGNAGLCGTAVSLGDANAVYTTTDTNLGIPCVWAVHSAYVTCINSPSTCLTLCASPGPHWAAHTPLRREKDLRHPTRG